MSVGDNGSLLCKSIIPVDVIEWLNSDGEVVASETSTSELSLTFSPVNTSVSNQRFTCRASKGGSVNKTTVVSVTGKITIHVVKNYSIAITLFYCVINSGRSSGSDARWPQQYGSHWRESHYQLYRLNCAWCNGVANFNSYTSKWN